MTTWLEKAKTYRQRQEAAMESLGQTAAEALGQLELLRNRMRELSVWALLPVGGEIRAGQSVWYLGRLYIARKALKKVLTEPPAAGECWEEWNGI